jgi:hypothetical protein
MKWEVTMIQFKKGKYKVTRRLPSYYVSETKMFTDKEEALRQFNEWLQ